MKVRVTKLQGVGPGVGHDAEGNVVQMLPQYTISGELLQELVVGGTIEVARTERNGLNIPGHFESSLITDIDGELVQTQSGSTYRVTYE